MSPTDTQLAVLRSEGRHTRSRFAALQKGGRLQGEFAADEWLYLRTIRFAPFGTLNKAVLPHTALPLLVRCFVVHSIELGLGYEAVYGRLQGATLAVNVLGRDVGAWIQPTSANLKRLREVVRHLKPATGYNRATAINCFFEYVNEVRRNVAGESHRLAPKRIRWKHGLVNIAHRRADPTTEEFAKHAARKHIPELHRYLAKAHAAFKYGGVAEPAPGFDLIRLEALTFAMALGIRSTELLTLPANAVGIEPKSGSTFVRVNGVKGSGQSMRPVTSLWAAPVSSAYAYLLEVCSEARARAREIETSGFDFVRSALRNAAREPLKEDEVCAQLRALGLNPEEHCPLADAAEALGLSYRTFAAGGRYYSSVVPLPAPVAARVVLWIDERFQMWDWCEYSDCRSDGRTGQASGRQLSVTKLGVLAGSPASCLSKAWWFYEELRELLVDLSRTSALGNASLPAPNKQRFLRRWRSLRETALSGRGKNACIVDIERLCDLLEEQYRSSAVDSLKVHAADVVVHQIPASQSAVRVSELLLVCWESQFDTRQRDNRLIPRPLSRAQIYNYLSGTDDAESVFARLGIVDEHGNAVSIHPHQIRHWVSTAVRRAGASETFVDTWMGRTPGQGRQYDHRTGKERAESARDMYTGDSPPDDWLGRKVVEWRERGYRPEDIAELVRTKLQVLHYVPWGACSRELTISPCPKALRCLRGFEGEGICTSFHIDTEDQQARQAVQDLRDSYATQLAQVEPELSNLESAFEAEMGDSEPLDLHIRFMREIIRGCDHALELFTADDVLAEEEPD